MRSFFKPIFNVFTLAALLSSLVGSAIFVTPARADTLTVTDCSAPVGASGRLVNVIATANDGDVINFSCSGTIVLASTLSISNNLRIDGSGQSVIISGGGNKRVIYISPTYSLTLENLTITNGYCDVCFGAGIYNGGNLTVNNSEITGNSAHTGGGIYNDGGVLSISNSTISGNSSLNNGGGIFSNAGITVTNSTFSDNSAGGNGGAVYIIPGSASPTSIVNSTFSGNSATDGGGIYDDGAELNLVNSTITGSTSGSGLYLYDSSGNGPMTVENSIIAGNTGGDCVQDGGVTFTVDAFNLDSDGSCAGATQRTLGEINLGPLQDNGGPTFTHALLPGSYAIDAGDTTVCVAVNTVNNLDQRGVSRGTLCDIGAYELNKGKTTFKSQGVNDGWVLESSETGNTGGTLNKGGKTLNVGDNAVNKQYRSILSFNTASLPDNAVITKVTLRVKRAGVVGGGNPITTFNGFMVDIKKGTFGTAALQLTDFNAQGNKTRSGLKPALKSGWYTLNLVTAKHNSFSEQINKTGNTQLRLRFKMDDNNNFIANYLKLYSGNAGSSSKPQLIIEYYVP